MTLIPQIERSIEYDGTGIPPSMTPRSWNTTSGPSSLRGIGNYLLEDEQVPERRGKRAIERATERTGLDEHENSKASYRIARAGRCRIQNQRKIWPLLISEYDYAYVELVWDRPRYPHQLPNPLRTQSYE